MIQPPNPYIIVKRYPYEEPYNLQIEFLISNGNFSSKVDIYCDPETLEKIGNGLKTFPTKTPDEYCYISGSEDPKDNFYRFFKIKAYTLDSRGLCALQFGINFNSFSKLNHLEFHWLPSGEQALFIKYEST